MKLRIFFDSYCPLCVNEMEQLKALDVHKHLVYADIHAPDFREKFPHIEPLKANAFLHAENEKGEMLYGLDVTCQAWALVNHHRWLPVLRWPVIRWFADGAYRLFAKHRYTISYLLTGQSRCEACDNLNLEPPMKAYDGLLENVTLSESETMVKNVVMSERDIPNQSIRETNIRG